MPRIDLDEEIRVAIVGAGGYGRVALDVLLASGLGDRVLGFYDDAHAALSGELRGVPILGDVAMLKSMLSVEPVHVVVAITDNGARLRGATVSSGRGRLWTGTPRWGRGPGSLPGASWGREPASGRGSSSARTRASAARRSSAATRRSVRCSTLTGRALDLTGAVPRS